MTSLHWAAAASELGRVLWFGCELTVSAQRPLPASLRSSTACVMRRPWIQVPAYRESPRDRPPPPPGSSKGWEFLQQQPDFYTNMKGSLQH